MILKRFTTFLFSLDFRIVHVSHVHFCGSVKGSVWEGNYASSADSGFILRKLRHKWGINCQNKGHS